MRVRHEAAREEKSANPPAPGTDPPAPERLLLVGRGPAGNRLASALRQGGFHVVRAATDTEGLALAGDTDAVLIDLDETHCLDEPATVARFGRAGAPVVLLASPRSLEQRVTLLDAGADDYVTKPVAAVELVARMHALLRRSARARRRQARVRADDIDLDFATRRAVVAGEPVALTAIEWRLLEELAGHPGAVLDHAHLTSAVWGRAGPTDTRALRVHIANLRRKLTGAGTPLIDTDHGLGYRWSGPPPDA